MAKFENRPRPTVDNDGSTKTDPSFAKRMDLRAIAERFGQQIEQMPLPPQLFGDQVAADRDPQRIAELVDERRSFFDALPARVRAVARNSAEEFARLVQTDEGLSSLTEAGLLLRLPEDPEPFSPSQAPTESVESSPLSAEPSPGEGLPS